MLKRIILIWTYLVLFSIIFISPTEANKVKVLILNSYHPGYAWSDNEQEGIISVLKKNYPDITINVEYLDSKNFPYYEHFGMTKNIFELKYKNKINYLAVMDNAALEFAVKYRNEIFKNVPVFFCGISDFNISMLNGEKNITGFEGVSFNIRGTVELALKALPNTKNIFIIHDYTATGLGFRKIAERDLQGLSDKVAIGYSPEYSLDDLLEMVKKLPRNTIILLLSFARDKNGLLIDNYESGEFLKDFARCPVFGITNPSHGFYITGGYLIDSRMHGGSLGDIIAKVISGESIKKFPIKKDYSAKPIFQYEYLKKYNILISKLPKESIILNRPMTVFLRYKFQIISTGLLIITLIIVIIILLTNIQLRRKATKKLKESEERYRLLFELESDALILIENNSYRILAANKAASELYGYTIKEFLKMKNLELSAEPEITKNFMKENAKEINKILFVPERKNKKKNGEIITVEITTTFFDLQGKNVQLAAMRDITKRKETENKLLEISSKHENILNNMNDMVCEIDEEGIYTFVNNRIIDIIGYKPEELIGKSAANFIHPDDVQTALAKVVELIKNNSYSIDNWRYRCQNGNFKTVECRSTVRTDENGNKKIIVISRDMTEKINTENALQESEKFLKEAQKIAKLGHYVFDVLSGSWECSEMLYEIFGINKKFKKDVDGWIDLVHPEEKDEMLNYLSNHVIKEKKKFNYEYRIIRKNDNKEIWVHGLGDLKIDKNGNVLEMFGTIQDITEQKIFEIELKTKTDELDRYFTSSLDLLCIADLSGHFRRLNPEWEKTLGYSLDELIGKLFLTFIHPDDIQNTLNKIKNLSEQKEVIDFTNRYRCKDGTYKWIEWRSYPVNNLIYAVARDITLRKEAEEKLQRSETLLTSVFEESPISKWLSDEKGYFLKQNQACRNLLKISDEDVVGKYNLFNDEIVKEQGLMHYINKVFYEGESVNFMLTYDISKIHNKSEPEIKILNVFISPIKNDAGNVTNAIVQHIDYTELKLAEKKLNKFNQELEVRVKERTVDLENAVNELEAFSYTVSHDLRSPLRAISGFSQILKEEYSEKLDDEGKRICSVINININRMSQLIDDLLTFSRLSRTEVQFSEIDMNLLVEQIFIEIKTFDNNKFSLKKDHLPAAFGDRAMMNQVFMNLISNAVKYSSKKERPEVYVGFQEDKDHIIYYVKDNGIGFDTQYNNKLYGVFQRLHNEKDYPGTGVGLAIVKRIIDRHNGRVWAESKIEKGATFYFSIPKK